VTGAATSLLDACMDGSVPDHPAILQVNTTDRAGGAARVAWDLFRAYRSRGYPSWLAVGRKRTDDPDVIAIPNDGSRNMWARTWRRIAQRLERSRTLPRVALPVSRLSALVAEPVRVVAGMRGREDFDFPGSRRILSMSPRRPDVLHAHNLHRTYFDLRILPELSHRVPMVLTLHDAWLLSGHCAHSLGCDRWKIGCGACPDLTLYPPIARDATAYNWNRKRDIFRRSRLFVATPSRWLMGKVEQSILAPAVREARVIPNGVDLRYFKPGDRRSARAALGLPDDAVTLLTTGTGVTQNVWKDYASLRDAVRIVSQTTREGQVLLLVLGDTSPDEAAGSARVKFVPHEQDPSMVARYYQAADVYVHAARADTFPSAILESLACGTPVVATAVGGIVEQLVDGKNGFVVPAGEPARFARRISDVLSSESLRRDMSSEAVRRTHEAFTLETQASSYLRWYTELFERSSRCGSSMPSGIDT